MNVRRRLVVFCGPPCSGKSYFSKEFSAKHSIPRLAMDDIRLELFPDGPHDATNRRLSYAAMHERAARLFEGGSDVVTLDGTYQPWAQRLAIQELVQKFDASVLILPMQVTEDDAAARFSRRDKNHAANDLDEARVRMLATEYRYGGISPITTSGTPQDTAARIERLWDENEPASGDQLVSWISSVTPSAFELESIKQSPNVQVAPLINAKSSAGDASETEKTNTDTDRRKATLWIALVVGGLWKDSKEVDTARKMYDDRGQITKDAKVLSLGFQELVGINVERARMLAELFGFGENLMVNYHAGNSHPDHGNARIDGHGYPHDYRGIAPYINPNVRTVDGPWVEELKLGNCVLTAGSTVSNEWARMYLPHLSEDPEDKVGKAAERALIINADEIPYAFYGGGQDLHRVYSMMWEGKEKRTRWNGIAYRNASKSRDVSRLGASSAGWLKEDFLLISKLPLYSPRGFISGTIVIAAGGHGAGTEAFRLLLDSSSFSDTELTWLYDNFRDEPFFQAVFKVSVGHDHRSRLTAPTRIELVRDDHLKPVDFHPSTQFLKRTRSHDRH